jgi:hypothetical protein
MRQSRFAGPIPIAKRAVAAEFGKAVNVKSIIPTKKA